MKLANGAAGGPVAPWFNLVQPWLPKAHGGGGRQSGPDPYRAAATPRGPDPRAATVRVRGVP